MSTYRIQLLGNFYLTKNDQAVLGFDSGRLQSFFAYLLVHGQTPQSRHYVAAVLWPDSAESQARTNLRKYIHRLRGVLPAADELFDLAGTQIMWRPDAPAVVDVYEFERYLTQAKEQLDSRQHHAAVAALEKAAALYQGALLPACYEEWIAFPRERLASQYIQLLDQLAYLLEREGAYNRAVQVVQHLLEQDTLRESSYRRLIHLHALAGNRAKALSAYAQCVEVLKQELDIEPSAATRQMIERVRGTMRTAEPQQGSQYLRKTMIWIDVVHFSVMVDQYGFRVAMDEFAAYTKVVIKQIQQDGGEIVKQMLDALLVMADHATDGLQIVHQVRAVLREFNEEQSENGRPTFHTRICLATGEVLLTQIEMGGVREVNAMGRCVYLVARLQSETPVDGVTFDQLTYTECKPLLKGQVTETVFSDQRGSEPIYILQ